jgi:hypothetical protein
MVKKYVSDMLLKYVESLNLPPCTNVYKRCAIESTHILQEEDDKILSLGMFMHPKEKKIEDQEEQVEEEWSSYLSSKPHNGNTQISMNTPSYTIDDDPPCDIIVSFMGG